MNMRSIKQLTLGTCAAMLVPLMSPADGYQFIISGDPVAAASANTSVSASFGSALVTSTRSFSLGPVSLEARYRTMDETLGVGLRSDPPQGMFLIIR
jgi:hypothetical protein